MHGLARSCTCRRSPIHYKGRLMPHVKAVVAIRVAATRGVILQGERNETGRG